MLLLRGRFRGRRINRVVYGCIGMEATTKSLRCGKGSGIRIASKWQLGVLVECKVFSSGWVLRAFEWCSEVIANEVVRECGCIVDATSNMGVLTDNPAVASSREDDGVRSFEMRSSGYIIGFYSISHQTSLLPRHLTCQANE